MVELTGATLEGVKTTKDGGWRVTFDFPGDKVNGLSAMALSTMRDESLKIQVSGPNEQEK